MDKKFFQQRALALSFLCAMGMVALEVSPWMALFTLGLVIWKFGVEHLNWRALSRRVTGVLSVLILAQVLFQYRTLVGQEPSYTFLLGLSGLRIMDYRNERDHRFLVLLGFVLISIKALFSVDIYWIIPSALAFGGFWFSLLPDHYPQRLRTLGKIFLLSIPLALVLFFAFPRFVLPWAMQRGTNYGQIGFSDELNPGKVAELAGSSNMVFRAKISNLPLKKAADLYWRGSVLNVSRGLSWRPGRVDMMNEPENVSGPTYEVALEPHANNYLFVLERTLSVDMETDRVRHLEYGLYRANRPIMATTAYRGTWTQETSMGTSPSEGDYLKVPELHGRVLDWVTTTRAENPDITSRIRALKTFFDDGGFAYTLSPGTYTNNDLETFLFDRKRGFCEHFAGSYATLARALGIPSRVVIGYQGGKYNPVGDFWRVAQRDAHAWVEILHLGRWRRVDPTTWIAPLRFVIGAEEFFNMTEEEQKNFAMNTNWRPKSQGRFALWDSMTFMVEDLNYRWTYFLVDFDRTSQENIWAELADHKLQTSLGGLFVLILCYFILRSLSRTRSVQSSEQLLIAHISEWGQAQQIPRVMGEAPLTYIDRLAHRFPQRAEILQRIRDYYDQRVYAQTQPENSTARELIKVWQKHK